MAGRAKATAPAEPSREVAPEEAPVAAPEEAAVPADETAAPEAPVEEATQTPDEAAGDQPSSDPIAAARAAALEALTSGGAATVTAGGEEGDDVDEDTPMESGVTHDWGPEGPFVVLIDAVNVQVGDLIQTAQKGDLVKLTADDAIRLYDLRAITDA